jgi:hypothetical protein
MDTCFFLCLNRLSNCLWRRRWWDLGLPHRQAFGMRRGLLIRLVRTRPFYSHFMARRNGPHSSKWEAPLFYGGGHSTTTFSSHFDLLPPSSGQLWTFWIIPSKLVLYTDHLPTSSCSRSYWMPLALLRQAHMTFHLEQFYLIFALCTKTLTVGKV